MELTGKCLREFETWFIKNDKGNPIKTWSSPEACIGLVYLQTPFKALPNSMRYGMYVDFFDAAGIKIFLWYNQYEICEVGVQNHYGDELKDRFDARIKAIEKANEIYNFKDGKV
jgi:hypothetical protein